jgi:hypothetical protein
MITKGAPGDNKQLASFTLIPSFVKKGRMIRVLASDHEFREAALVDIDGRIVQSWRFSGSFNLETSQLQRGVYFVRIRDSSLKMQVQRFVVTD